MKKLFVIAALVLVLILVLQLVSFACTPPPEPADCSPGFWKNHTELWYDDPQWADPAFMLAALKAKGNDEVYRPHRFEVTGWLNAAYPCAPCDD